MLTAEELLTKRIAVNKSMVADPLILEALDLIEWAINERELREYILNFRNSYGVKQFLQTCDSNLTILRKFVQGAEHGTEIDYEWDYLVDYFTSDGDIIGYTEEDSNEINLNTTYLQRDLPEICNTLVHEFCHLVGMEHSFYNPGFTIWKQTAPYAIGQYVQYMIERKMGLDARPPFFPTATWGRRVAYKIKRLFKRLF